MLDKLSPLVRHFILLVTPVILGFASTDLLPILQNVNPIAASFAAAILAQAVLVFSKLTTQYGSGSDYRTQL